MKIDRQGGFLIARIHQLAGRIFSRSLRRHGVELNAAQGRIMFALWQHGGMPIQSLAGHTSLGKSTLTSMLDRLERMGYVTRGADPRDRRKTIIEVTAKDRALRRLHERVSGEMIALFYKGLSGADITQFERSLERILHNLESVAADEGGAGK